MYATCALNRLMEKKDKRFQMRFTDSLLIELKKAAEQADQSIAQYTRAAIREKLNRDAKEKK